MYLGYCESLVDKSHQFSIRKQKITWNSGFDKSLFEFLWLMPFTPAIFKVQQYIQAVIRRCSAEKVFLKISEN